MKKHLTVLWDFNGTIYNDVEISFRSINELLERHGKPPLADLEAYREVFGFPIRDYYERVGFDFSRTPFEVLAPEWVAIYNSLDEQGILFPDAVTALEYFRKAGCKNILLSATEGRMLLAQVNRLKIHGLFDQILGTDTIHGTGKETQAREYKLSHPDEDILVIGDSVHDAQVAKSVGGDCLLIAAGHQCEARLKETGFPVLSSLSDIFDRLR